MFFSFLSISCSGISFLALSLTFIIRLVFGGLKRLFWKLEKVVALVRCESKQLCEIIHSFLVLFTMDSTVDVCWAYERLF